MPPVSYTEDEVAEAMLDVTDNGLSQNKSAQKREIPRSTLGDRLRGLPSRSEVTQPAQLLSKPEESRLVAWILRQEALGYAPSHSQVRTTVNALLRQQGREKPVGVHWLARFMKRHPSIKTKIGKRQEASRFNCFTPTAVNWYFDIREREYGWIKPENTVNVDEGGIMAGFGLDSLVVGSSDPRKKAFLKGSQSRTWTSFIEAVTATGRLLKPPSRSEVTQPAQLLSKPEESRLVAWILRQEALGYAPSHSQVRTTVNALLRQQGREKPVGVHWLARFMKRHPSIKTKIGKRQEASRFNCFTPTAVNWYFDIREREYGWIKPENTVNVDEGGIMAGFGLDSLVVGSSDPRKKAFLKGSQSRTWTSFIEAVTATGRLLKPGIIFKGKELQQQWFIDELKEVADWYYITSDNGWTDNHIAVEWLREVYLPQTQPEDESDARLIILDGHRSHVSDEWMATCFLNNVYCCYLPAHCSHGLQPLDNGVFNASKAAYRKELQKLATLTDSAPVDKVNFIKAYAKAREVGMTKKNILSGWRVTGNWPISRRKALMHPEIQPDKKETTPASDGRRDGQVDSDNTPKTSRHIRDLGKNKSPSTRRRYSVISKGFEAQESKIASLSSRVASLEEEVGRLSRGKKRKAIPNPNRKFMTLAEALVAGDAISGPNQAAEETEAVEEVIEVGGVEEDEGSNSEAEELPVARTRAGRAVKRPRQY
ncbi:hypothetical protein FOMG_18845 [Fusarium oxysporum f. sp. melonis 26406]|uniref:HTH CENPB-type domain-containing protein n=1 Tax=Fusarium oxysporum f. sp. melonis 26406 TaxID=1089452 RepID=W9YXY9_FUSOX|nr:hypothetical protein FOMG_18845 [Fusarium oxysporum f. sp. melonis 26406]